MRRGLLTLVVLFACRDRPPPPPPPAPPHDGVVVLEPGAPPLAMLRYRLTKGSKTASELMYDVDVKSDGQSGPLPTLVVDLETAVQDVRADGTAELRITVTEASVRDRPGSQLPSDLVQAQVAALRGAVITETLAPDGTISGARVQTAGTPDKASSQLDNLLRSLERVAMRLPAEPVGIGAMWRERRTLPEGGIRAVSEITYRLASLASTGFSYTGSGQATGVPHTIEQDGVKVEVADSHGSAEVHGSIDLSHYAIEATATSTFAATMTVVAPDAGPGAARSTVEIAMAVHMTPGAQRPGAAGASEPSALPDDAGAAPTGTPSPVPPPGTSGSADSAPR